MEILEDHEVQAIIMNALEARGEEGVTESELKQIVDWANKIKLNNTIVDLVIEGRVSIMHYDKEQDQPLLRAITSLDS